MQKVIPTSCSVSQISIIPWCRSMISLAIDSPSPAPGMPLSRAALPRKKRVNACPRSSEGMPGPVSDTLTTTQRWPALWRSAVPMETRPPAATRPGQKRGRLRHADNQRVGEAGTVPFGTMAQ